MIRRIGLVLIAAVLAACSRTPVPAGYDFVTHSLPSGSGMDALVEGGLSITRDEVADAWCLLVVRGSRDVTFVAWPDRFTLVLADDGKVEVHGDGKVARQGDQVRLGGGHISRGVHHSVQSACQSPFPYFAVQSLS